MALSSSFLLNNSNGGSQGGANPQVTGTQAYQDLYSRLIGTMTLNDVSQRAGNNNWAQQRQLFDNQNGGGFSAFRQSLRDQQEQERIFSNRLRYQGANQKDDSVEYHKANELEAGLIDLQEAGKALMEGTGFARNRQNLGAFDPRTLGSFGLTIPVGPATGLSEAPSDLYEALTGHNLTQHYKADDGTWQVANDDLDTAQRWAQGVNAGINSMSPIIGGAGDFLTAGVGLGRNLLAGRAGRAAAGEVAETAAQQAGRGAAQAAGQAVREGGEQEVKSLGRRIWENGPWGALNRRAGNKRLESGDQPSARSMILSDMAEEGAEEFTQSYLEDIRQESLDEGSFGRAVEGALWGAAGGGVMGGGAVAMNAVNRGLRQEQEEVNDNASEGTHENQSTPSNRFAAFSTPMRQTDRDHQVSAAEQWATEQRAKHNDHPGQITAKLGSGARRQLTYTFDDGTTYTTNPNVNNIDFGYDDLYNIYHANINGRDYIASRFGLTVGQVDDMFARRTDGSDRSAEVINQNIQTLRKAIRDKMSGPNGKYNGVGIAFAKNPDTPEAGCVFGYINDIVPGSGVNADPIMIELIRSDADGDTGNAAIAGPAYDVARQENKFATQLLSLRDSANTNLSYDYATFNNRTDQNNRTIREWAARLGLSPNAETELQRQFQQAIGTAEKPNNNPQRFTDFFNNAVSIIRREHPGDITNLADVEVGELFESLKATNQFDIIENQVLPGTVRQNKEHTSMVEAIGEYSQTAGLGAAQNMDIHGVKHLAQLASVFNLSTGMVQDAGHNPVFRQCCALGYLSKGRPLTDVDYAQLSEDMRVAFQNPSTELGNFISKVMKLNGPGADPENVVNALFLDYVYQNTMDRYIKESNGKTKVYDKSDFDLFSKIFAECWNDGVDKYAAAIKDTTIIKDMENLGRAVPQSIPFSDGKPMVVEFSRAFTNMFGGDLVDSLLQVDDSFAYFGWTWNAVIDNVYHHPDVSTAFSYKDFDLTHFVANLANNYRSRAYVANQSLMKDISEIVGRGLGREIASALSFDADGVAHIEVTELSTLDALQEFYTQLLPPKAWEYLPTMGRRIASISSRAGIDLYLAETVEDAANALLRVALAANYFKVMGVMNQLNETDNQARKEELAKAVLTELSVKQNNSTLHRMIFRDAENRFNKGDYDGLTTVLDRLMSVDITLADKEEYIARLSDETEVRTGSDVENGVHPPLLVWALATSDSEMDLAAYSTRRRKAKNAYETAINSAHSAAVEQVRDFRVRFVDGVIETGDMTSVVTEQDKMTALQYLLDTASNEFSQNAAMTMMVDNLDVVKEMVEKALDTDSQVALSESLQNMLYGGHQAFVEATTGYKHGLVPFSDFKTNTVLLCRCLSDGNFTVRVMNDEDGNAIRTVNREAIFRDACGERWDGTYSLRNYLQVFEKYPEVFTHIGRMATSIVMSNSQMIATDKKQSPTVSTLLGVARDAAAKKNELYEQMLKNVVTQRLANTPRFYGLLAVKCGDISKMSDAEILSELRRSWDSLVDFFYELTNIDPASPDEGRCIFHNMMSNTANLALVTELDKQLDLQYAYRDMIINGRMPDESFNTMVQVQINALNNIIWNNHLRARFGERLDQGDLASIGLNRQRLTAEIGERMAQLEQMRLIYLANMLDHGQETFDEHVSNLFTPSVDFLTNARDVYTRAGNQEAVDFIDNLSSGQMNFRKRFTAIFGDMFTGPNGRRRVTFDMNGIDQVLRMLDPGNVVEHQCISPFILSCISNNAMNCNTVQDRNALIAEITEAAQNIHRYVWGASSTGRLNPQLAAELDNTERTVQGLVNAVYNARGNEQDRIRAVNNLLDQCHRWNAAIVDECILRSKGGTQAAINENAATELIDQLSAIHDIERLVDQAREEYLTRTGWRPDNKPKSLRKLFETLDLPAPHTVSAANSFWAEQAINSAATCQASSIVTDNSLELYAVGACALIPEAHHCSAGPTVMTVRQIREMMENDNPMLYNLVGFAVGNYSNGRAPESIMKLTREALRNIEADRLTDDDTECTLWLRNICTEGNCSTHTRVDYRQRGLDEPPLMNIIARIIKDAKESMSLRLKKSLGIRTDCVNHVEMDPLLLPSHPNNSVQITTTDEVEAWDQIRDLFVSYRLRLAKDIYQEWMDNGITNVSQDDAMEVAEYICSTAQIIIPGPNGIENRVFSLNQLLPQNLHGDAADVSVLTSLISETSANGSGGPLFTVQVNPLSLATIAGRIMDEAVRWQAAHPGQRMTLEDREGFARVLTDWSDFHIDDDTFTISDILNQVNVKPIGVQENLRTATSQTPGRRMRAETSRDYTSIEEDLTPYSNLDKDRRDAIALSNQELSEVGSNKSIVSPANKITAVFARTNYLNEASYDNRLTNAFSALIGETNENPDGKGDVAGTGFVLVLSAEQFDDAIDYARKLHKDVLIGNDVISKLESGQRMRVQRTMTNKRYELNYGKDDKFTFHHIDVRNVVAGDAAGNVTFQFEEYEFNPANVIYQAFDPSNLFGNTDSGSIGFADAMRRLDTPNVGDVEIDVNDRFFQGRDERMPQPIDHDDISQIDWSDGGNVDFGWYRNNFHWRDGKIDALRRNVATYVSAIQDGSPQRGDYDENYIKQFNFHTDDCIAIYKKTFNVLNDDGELECRTTYVPIFLESSAADYIDHFSQCGMVDNRGGRFVARWQTQMRVQPGDKIKLYVQWMAEKTIIDVRDESEYPPPTLALGSTGLYTQPTAGIITAGNSSAGRSYGKDDLLIAENMATEMASMGGSIFFHAVPNPNGGYTYIRNQEVLDSIRDSGHEADYDTIFDCLVQGKPDQWRSVADGAIRLSGDTEMNRIYRLLARACLGADIDLRAVFSPVTAEGKIPCKGENWRGLFNGFNLHQILRFYHHMSLDCSYSGQANANYCHYCPDGLNDQVWLRVAYPENGRDPDKNALAQWRWDDGGRMLVQGQRLFIRVICPMPGQEFSRIRSSKTNASYSFEHRTFDLMDDQIIPRGEEFGRLLEQYANQFGYYDVFHQYDNEDDLEQKARSNPYGIIHERTEADLFGNDEMAYISKSYRENCRSIGTRTMQSGLTYEGSGTNGQLTDDEDRQLQRIKNDFRRELGWDGEVTDYVLSMIYQAQTGFTITDAPTARTKIPFAKFATTLDFVIKQFAAHPGRHRLLIRHGILEESQRQGRERIPLPMFDREFARMLWNNSSVIQESFHEVGSDPDFQAYEQAMFEEMQEAEETIERDILDSKKKQSLYRWCDYVRTTWGYNIPIDHIFRDGRVIDRARARIPLMRLAESDPDLADDFADSIDEAENRMQQREQNFQNYRRRVNTTTVEGAATRSGISTHPASRNGFLDAKLWSNLCQIRRTLGVMSPFMPAASFIGRITCGGVTNFMLRHNMDGLGRFMYEPGIQWSNPQIAHQIARDPRIQKWISAMMAATYSGELEAFQHLHSEEDLDNWINDHKAKKDTFWQKLQVVQDKIFYWANAGKAGRNLQIELFLNRMGQLLGNDQTAVGQMWSRTYEVDGREVSEYEMALQNDPIGTMVELFGGVSGQLAAQAWNFALAGDFAQRNIVSEVVQRFCARYGLANLFVTSCISPYFTATTNMVGRALSTICPMSTLHYLIVNRMSQMERFQDWNLEDIQTRRSLKEAIHADMVHMGAGFLGIVLATLAVTVAGAFEPPDDDDKIVNVNEWKLLGMPINVAWWLEDNLGIALPYACTWAAIFLGKAQYAGQILANGIADVCYNNPLFSVADLVDGFFETAEAFTTDSSLSEGDFSKAPGGQPGFWESFGSQGVAGTLNWFAQFFTPSVVKEVGKAWQKEKPSYKYVYQRDANGNIAVDPDTGRPLTERVSEAEAQIRRLTRNNPMFGLLCNAFGMVTGGRTDYLSGQMPLVEYTEPIQQWSYQHYNLYNDDGTEKTDVEKQAIALEVINTLATNDDMEALWKSGFYIPPKTKYYVGQCIYDIIHSLEENYQALNLSGAFNYKSYGDWDTGEAIVKNVKAQYDEEISKWYDLFNDKLYSEPMRRPMLRYNQLNTMWQQDANGEWYATAFPYTQLSLDPIIHPLTYENMGAEYDYATPSQLDPTQSTGMRALVPVDQDFEEKPDFDSLGSDDANGFSGAPTGVYGSAYSGYGGYGYGGGGGGGSSRPSIRSFSPSLNISYPTTMNTGRWYGSSPDYLRPDFETKGSREASRRSDF